MMRRGQRCVVATTATPVNIKFDDFTNLAAGNDTVTESYLGDVPLEVKDGDGGDPS